MKRGKNSISVAFHNLKNGWLHVDFSYKDFYLSFMASTVLNNPIDELVNIILKLQNKETRRLVWWLEPNAYFFDFEKNEKNITLTIIETESLHNESSVKKQLIQITGNNTTILEPFRNSIEQFKNKGNY